MFVDVDEDDAVTIQAGGGEDGEEVAVHTRADDEVEDEDGEAEMGAK
jgi:hypothetical protein